MRPIYLDHNATTPLDPVVFDVMTPYFLNKFGNASSSSHDYGWEAKAAVDFARASLAKSVGAPDAESIVFTSGSTESNVLALEGVLNAAGKGPWHIISQVTEHVCVLQTLENLKRQGHEVTLLKVDSEGLVDIEEFRSAFKSNTRLVSVMTANNEIGTLQNIQRLVSITREKSRALFHTDAAQAVGKIPLCVLNLDVDLMSFSAHKIHGPKGIGALYRAVKKNRISLSPIFRGGGQEFGLRSGTVHVAGVVGFAKALELSLQNLETEIARQTAMGDYFKNQIFSRLKHVSLNGSSQKRLANNMHFHFQSTPAEEIMREAKAIAVSSGAACSSATHEPSHVLRAIGLSDEEAKCSLRVSLGRFTSQSDVEQAAAELIRAVDRVRENSPVYQAWQAEIFTAT